LTGYRVTQKAVADLDRHAQWLASEAGADVAARFLDSARSTFEKLSDNAGWGAPFALQNGRLQNLRKWRVAGFSAALIFYKPTKNGVEIIRVFHAAQDWIAVLDPH
jgi:toxin ParE1/3/4